MDRGEEIEHNTQKFSLFNNWRILVEEVQNYSYYLKIILKFQNFIYFFFLNSNTGPLKDWPFQCNLWSVIKNSRGTHSCLLKFGAFFVPWSLPF